VRRLGFATVIFSNQSGVARGMFGEDDVHAVNRRVDELLLASDPAAVVDRHEFCPFHPEGTVEAYRMERDRRKPGAGMIHTAAEALGLDPKRSWVVGDAPRDIEAGAAAGCRTILVKDASLKASPAAEAAETVKPDFVVASLREAAEVIERETATRASTTAPSSVATEATQAPTPEKPAPASAEPARPAPLAVTSKGKSKDQGEASPLSTKRVEELLEEVLDELRRREDVRADFSVTKLIAGIAQVIALAVLFMAYLRRDTPALEATLLTALVFQTFTIALLIMERQR
jgi:histidinol-phosphate phosphatase family protein